MNQILIIDDDPAMQMLLKRALCHQGYEVAVASNGEEGLVQVEKLRPALVICDWIMPGMNGLDVCRQLKVTPGLSTTIFILVTSRNSIEDRVEGLDAGADDFLCKPIEIAELNARVRAGLRLHQLSHDLQHQKQLLEGELAEAAEYVSSILPDRMIKPSVTIDTRFIPSRKLGGDGFDYYWLDSEHLAIYLLDAAGHGLRAALPTLSVLNLLRSRALKSINYYEPSDVLRGLNQTFQITERNDKYFTVWYGVYNQVKRQLVYASAGHPPAILIAQTHGSLMEVQRLKTPGLPVGMFPDADYIDQCCEITESSTLYIFSDGIYEINQSNGNVWGLEPFIRLLAECKQNHNGACHLDLILKSLEAVNPKHYFDDDLSLLEINFV
ncbi:MULTISPECIES: SpoIIE family protein phosphatase [Moorena]|uniref:Serine phosphatase RsbU, regulator of sigma subunit n=1 Tax=Moorena producens 3L TaxID=489825 RepID=F4XU09_9CYAN|nr:MULTISPECIES: SpoIIE family protein phosphatase [Moorena]NEQ15657.1 SpoIIE family protein phosphatase [Moorena sp. SIO3E2]NES84160.1 SpoIIE family protein phosphatase [Moorena sp. SIO2B7]EGJ31985.1 serine phosphatase RsbU, regulator of sigma subunit [Moorena producens 3L]NEP33919.1 SpoIIE family protein phosphatase [Moorena sp. SIO3B2]NEP64734.1 SpoIIE family protein phosphatase [Moorena sp. SIO3A5]